EVLNTIRDCATQVRDAIEQGLLNNLPTEPKDRITDAELFVIDILRAAHVNPRYANSTFLQRAVTCARTIASKSPVLSAAIELITTNLQPEWARRPETAFRLRFRRDSFWHIMEDPIIRQALRQLGAPTQC